MEVVASLSQGRTAAAQCGLFTYKSVPVIFEPPCIRNDIKKMKIKIWTSCIRHRNNLKLYVEKAETFND